MKKIIKIGAMSLGRILGLMYAVMGLVFGGVITFVTSLGSALMPGEAGNASILVGVGAIIVLPIMYGILGFLFGLLTGWLFNLIARYTGGLEIEIEENKEKPLV